MKKKGFTLVELLAVIAILAILVIIALPNVMGMFNQAKQNSFSTEIKEIYKQAQQQWISDSMLSTDKITYYRVGGVKGATTGNGIDLTGRTQLDYSITIEKSGAVSSYFATDGSYQYLYKGTELNVEDIGSKDMGQLKADMSIAAPTETGVVKNNVVDQVSELATNKQLTIAAGGAASFKTGE